MLFRSLDGSVSLSADPAAMTQIENAADDDYDKWVGQGDCLVLVTKSSVYRTTDIRQIRIYYRVTTNQAGVNAEAAMRYYETADWGEGTASTSNGHTDVATELNTCPILGEMPDREKSFDASLGVKDAEWTSTPSGNR